MSHIGNWELAAQTLNKKGLPIMLYLGARNKEQLEHIQKQIMAQSGIRVVVTSEDEKSPFALIEGINFLREGGIVSMAGDRLWGKQNFVTVNFLGYEARLPDTPHLFALMTGAPLMTFLCIRKHLENITSRFRRGERLLPPRAPTEKKQYRNRLRSTPKI